MATLDARSNFCGWPSSAEEYSSGTWSAHLHFNTHECTFVSYATNNSFSWWPGNRQSRVYIGRSFALLDQAKTASEMLEDLVRYRCKCSATQASMLILQSWRMVIWWAFLLMMRRNKSRRCLQGSPQMWWDPQNNPHLLACLSDILLSLSTLSTINPSLCLASVPSKGMYRRNEDGLVSWLMMMSSRALSIELGALHEESNRIPIRIPRLERLA